MNCYNVYGYIGNDDLLAMLCLHLCGTFAGAKRNVAMLRKEGVIDDNGNIQELSFYFEQQIDNGYWSDDYFEFIDIDIEETDIDRAIAQALKMDYHWVYLPDIDDLGEVPEDQLLVRLGAPKLPGLEAL